MQYSDLNRKAVKEREREQETSYSFNRASRILLIKTISNFLISRLIQDKLLMRIFDKINKYDHLRNSLN